jgi:hypothetical protein
LPIASSSAGQPFVAVYSRVRVVNSTGQGSSPYAWGIAGADKVLLDSLVAQQSNGSLVIGRGVRRRGSTVARRQQ